MGKKSFDYIVIGAGSAGCVVANRLSADPNTDVLLLEAGPEDRNPWIHVPVGYYRTMYDPEISWGYETEQVPGAARRTIKWPRGRVLGGCSAINGLVYARGQREDFDHWRQLGNQGWAYDDVLPYFIRSEAQSGKDPAFHGHDGPLGVSTAPRAELCDAFIAACEEAGIPRNDDYNGPVQEGVAYFQLTVQRGKRTSTARAFLKPVQSRPNLWVITGALATRILFDGTRATGVRYALDGGYGSDFDATARGEIILCGGAINSPQLLQLSGIGPGELLQEHGLEVIHDAPGVGENLQDHYQSRSIYECNRPLTVNDEVKSLPRKCLAGLQWLFLKGGPLTVSAGQVGVFTKTRPELASPDIQFHFIRFSSPGPGHNLHKFSGFTVSVCQLRPESRGYVRIRSSSALEKPFMQPYYLDAEQDQRTMVDGLKISRNIMRQSAIAQLVRREVEPGPDCISDGALLEYIRASGTTIFHPSGTCKMGNDALAVVDERLRVHGVDGLRVADASIMPTVASSNTNAVCIMIGEKVSDMIKTDAR